MRVLKKISFCFFFLFAVFLLPAVASAATYNVRQDGAGNYTTIQACANAAQAGDTCLVNSGNYNERVSTVRSGTASNRIYIKGATSAKPTVSGFTFSHAYVTVEGFLISNTGTAVSIGGGGNYCELNNNEFLGAEEGIDMSGSPTGCRIRGNWFHGNTLVSVLITLRGSGHVVEENEFGPLVMHEDIFRPFGDNNTIKNNYFRNITSGNTGGHMDIFQIFGGASDRRVTNLLFEQNFVNGWPGQAWMVDCTSDSRLITVRNNVFYNVNSAGQSYCPENLIYSNTFAYSGQGNGRAVMIRNGADEGAPSRGLGINSKIKNNIFYYTSYPGNAYAGGYDVDDGAQSSFEGRNNIAYPQTSSGLALDTNSQNGVDPRFVNASNAVGADGRPFTADDGLIPPTNSPACGAGEAETDIGTYKCGGAGLPAAGPPSGGGGNQPPTVSITSPTNNATFNPDTTIQIEATASDSADSISQVAFYRNGAQFAGGIDTTAPWNYQWGNASVGTFTIYAEATDNRGAVGRSASITITVGSPITSPPPSTCVNPTTLLGAAPCPVLSLSTDKLTVTATPSGSYNYIYKTFYISEYINGRWQWSPFTFSCGSAGDYCTTATSFTIPTNLRTASPGIHYIASWDWKWSSGRCWLGPGATVCDTQGQWRVQSFEEK
ncbi:MAG: chitinase [Parcubacteria group bacterium Gr01-1014_73]|nr:MAG: chitinase [Parcubacteria group bacterium Gr01-1014_73]